MHLDNKLQHTYQYANINVHQNIKSVSIHCDLNYTKYLR